MQPSPPNDATAASSARSRSRTTAWRSATDGGSVAAATCRMKPTADRGVDLDDLRAASNAGRRRERRLGAGLGATLARRLDVNVGLSADSISAWRTSTWARAGVDLGAGSRRRLDAGVDLGAAASTWARRGLTSAPAASISGSTRASILAPAASTSVSTPASISAAAASISVSTPASTSAPARVDLGLDAGSISAAPSSISASMSASIRGARYRRRATRSRTSTLASTRSPGSVLDVGVDAS